MPNYTTNLNLELPLDDEQYDVAVTRRNNQLIDDFAGLTPPRALTADKLTTGAHINGVLFKGDEDIEIPPSGANIDLQNLSALGNARLQYAPFAINSGSVLNGENNTIRGNSVNYKKYNINEYGTLNKSYGIVSGFSTGNYINLNPIDLASSNSFEMVFKIKLTSSGYCTIFSDTYANNYHKLMINIGAGNTLQTYGYLNFGNTWLMQITGTTVLSLNTDYWIKLTYDSTNGYELLLSTDGINYTSEGTDLRTTAPQIDSTWEYSSLGISYSNGLNFALLGSINLSQSYIKVDDDIVWQGVINGTSENYDYIEILSIVCSPCIITTVDNRTKIFESSSNLSIANINDGDYLILKDYETGNLSLVSEDNFKIGKTESLNPLNGDFWFDISTVPASLKVYNNTENDWIINNDLVYIGNCTIQNGIVVSLINREFNNSGYNVQKYIDYNKIFEGVTPDLSKGINKSTSGFTADEDGWVCLVLYAGVSGDSVYIDNAMVAYRLGNGYAAISVFIPILKGQTLTATTTLDTCIFYPLKK